MTAGVLGTSAVTLPDTVSLKLRPSSSETRKTSSLCCSVHICHSSSQLGQKGFNNNNNLKYESVCVVDLKGVAVGLEQQAKQDIKALNPGEHTTTLLSRCIVLNRFVTRCCSFI